MHIVILRGFSGAGKDTVGQILVDEYRFKRCAFADSLKVIVSQTYGIPLGWLHDQKKKQELAPDGRTWRQILLDVAQQYRNENPTIFAEMCCKDIQESERKRIVITDWRYPNELDVVQATFPQARIFPVWVNRAEQKGVSPVENANEYLLQDRVGDWEIENSGDMAHLEREVHRMITDFVCGN